MSNITLLRTKVEKNIINPKTAVAPAKAAIITAIYPEKESPAEKFPTVPPNNNITKATPKLAPESMPKIEGPAKGFAKRVCNNNPDTASAAPANKAVTACGKRVCNTIKAQEVFSASSPIRIRTTARKGISTEPIKRQLVNKIAIINSGSQIILRFTIL